MHSERLHSLRLRWRTRRKRRELDRNLAEELQFHLEMKAAKLAERGIAASEARHSAARQFGNETLWKETLYEMWTWNWLESAWLDAKQAARSLRRTPAVAVAAALVLGIGSGAATAVFTVVDAAVLRPIPFSEPERLVLLWGNVLRQKVERRGNSYPDHVDWKAQARSFEGMAAVTDGSFTLTGVDEPERIPGEYVSAGYFELLNIKPLMGRVFTAAEDIPNGPAVAVINEGLWRRRFGADSSVIGRKLILNNRPFTVIGVMPAFFHGATDEADVWAPFLASGVPVGSRGTRGFTTLARLSPGVTLGQAQAEMDVISRRLEQAWPDTNSKRAVEVALLSSEVLGPLQTPLLVLLSAVCVVLLIACANVATLLLARAEARQSEFALRVALGAGKIRLFSQQLAEGLVLAIGGAVVGLLLAWVAVYAMVAFSPVTLPTFVQPRIDWRVAVFALAMPVAAGILAALAPAFRAANRSCVDALKEGGTRVSGKQGLRGVLVTGEVALAVTLLVGAGLLIRSFRELSAIHPGFDPEGVLTLSISLSRIDPSASALPDSKSAITGDAILERVRGLPGVSSASLASDLPLDGGGNGILYTAEGQGAEGAQTQPRAVVHRVSPEYFQTLRCPIRAGRTFTTADSQPNFDGIIVSESLVRRFWPGQDGVGKRIKPGTVDSKAPWWQIVGVVGEMKLRGLPENPTADPDVYFPFSPRVRQAGLILRTPHGVDPGALSQTIRNTIKEIDKSVPVYNVATLGERIGTANSRARFAAWLMGIFAAFALLLTSIGLYALISWTVRRQTREIGIRIAIGAARTQVLAMILSRGLRLVVAGLVIGLAAAVIGTRSLSAMLVGVKPLDVTTFVLVPVILLSVGALATYWPARRASLLDASTALRQD